MPKQNVILCILDGWGISPDSPMNGISQASLPNWNRFLQTYPHTSLLASELSVGLPEGQMGNSEVGHMTIGSGRIIYQDLPRIDQAIENKSIASSELYRDFIKKSKMGTNVIHIMGLLSPGGVHSHQNHLLYFANSLAQEGLIVHVHAFLDGRDTPPQSALEYLKEITNSFHKNVTLSTVCGRYYAMDRDKRWDRSKAAYQNLTQGSGERTTDFLETIKHYYLHNIGDEFIPPLVTEDYLGMNDGDSLFMLNFRADRVRQILSALTLPNFHEFDREKTIHFSATMGMTEYSENLLPYVPALFPQQSISNTLGELISKQGLKQLRAAETEKYAHVTFFLNGGREQPFDGEERLLIPSPHVATYDLKPEMSAPELTDALVNAIEEKKNNLIVVNYANPDMVGHTGVQPAIKIALETIDSCLGKLEKASLDNDYTLLITADHGNVEQMLDEKTNQPHTAHTLNPVPFLIVNPPQDIHLKNGGLSDIAPTLLQLMGIPIPKEMTGKVLF